MKIIADENIPFVQQAFSTLGEVITCPGRDITTQTIANADILLVRSVTSVSPELLEGSKLKFIATATIGLDHVDVDYLREQSIGFASAPGSNANSVAEYVLSALFVLGERQVFELHEKTVGIVGCGNVGSKVLAKLQSLGVKCLVNDPPLQEQTEGQQFVELPEVLSADIITLHVPLERGDRYPTYHMIDEVFLSRMQKGAILINTSRGSVIDESALNCALNEGNFSAVLDVWEGEPEINTGLLTKVEITTPHIAGYSFDGKVNGTRMIYEAACRNFNVQPSWNPEKCMPEPLLKSLTISKFACDMAALQKAILACYDIRKDDITLRQILNIQPESRRKYFETLRKNYPIRREFNNSIICIPNTSCELANKIQGVGFKVKRI